MADGEREVLTAPVPHRGSLRGANGCITADHPLGAQAGLRALALGGSAADAAIAAAAVMTVVQPHNSQLGGDLFALVYDPETGEVAALNSSGPAARRLDPQEYRDLGSIPDTGPLAVTVPGVVAGWWSLHQRCGRLAWASLFEQAAAIARDGFPASRNLARHIEQYRGRCYPAGYFKELFGRVAGDGGQGVVQQDLARTLDAIAAGGQDAFYTGEIRDACIAALNGRGGCFDPEDWVPPARWGEPVSGAFAGFTVHTQPPPSQGFILPLALQRYAAAAQQTPVTAYEAIRTAFADRNILAGDPDFCDFDVRALLAGRQPVSASSPALPGRDGGDTTYIAAIDAEGNAISLIQSVFAPFGSGVFVPGTGILMNNRMCGFTLQPGHPNEIAGGKRPMHTLHSYMVTVEPPPLLPLAEKLGERPLPAALAVVGGTPGAMQQPQTNLQVLDHILREGMDPQDALDQPRWSMSYLGVDSTGAGRVAIEQREPNRLAEEFRAAGFQVQDLPSWDGRMGRSYVAVMGPAGVHVGADLRGEGQALVY